MTQRKRKTIDKIIKLKDNKKRELEIEVKKARERLESVRAELENLERNYVESVRCFEQRAREGEIDAGVIHVYHEYFKSLAHRIQKQRDLHERKKRELEVLKDSLISTHKEKRILEIMNERILNGEIKEKASKEQKEMDFMSLIRRSRR